MTRYIQSSKHIWNHFDEFGLLVGVERLDGETNAALKARILARYSAIQNSTYQGLTNAISSDLGYDIYNVIDKKIYILTYIPEVDRQVAVSVDGVEITQIVETWPLPSGWTIPPGVDFNVDPSGIMESVPGVYGDPEASGYLIWRDDTGEYTRILEFTQAPETGSNVVIEYYYKIDGYIRYYREYIFQGREREERDLYGQYGFFTARSREDSTGISIHALSDSEYRTNPENNLMTEEGTATELLTNIAKLANDAAPVLWDYFRWDEGRWDAGDREETGSEALPALLDASTSGYFTVGEGW